MAVCMQGRYWLLASSIVVLQHENDPAYALLHDFVDKQDPVVRIGAIMGLGLAYAGTQKEEASLSFSTILSDRSGLTTDVMPSHAVASLYCAETCTGHVGHLKKGSLRAT